MSNTAKWPKGAANPVGTFTIFDTVWPAATDMHEYANKKWSTLVERVQDPATAINKQALKLISFAQYGDELSPKNCIRHAANVRVVYGVEIDYDLEKMTLSQAAGIMTAAKLEAVLYTSPSHTTEKPRWRILLPLSQGVEPEKRRDLVGIINRLLGGVVSRESFTLSQSFYIGRVAGAVYEVLVTHGRCVDETTEFEPLYPVDAKNTGDAGPRDQTTDAELRDNFYKGIDRYQSMLKLSSRWALQGIEVDDIEASLLAMFDDAGISTKNKDGIDLRKRVPEMARTAVSKYGESRRETTTAETEAADFEQGPPCLVRLSTEGFPQASRENALFAIAIYLKKRYPDDWEEHLHAYNVQFFKPPVSSPRVKSTIRSLMKKDYNYSCKKSPMVSVCNRTVCVTCQFGVGKDDDADWGIEFGDDIKRVMTRPPFWVVFVNGVKMELQSNDFLTQQSFVKKCIDTIKKMPKTLSKNAWTLQVNKILETAVDEEAPEDASIGGELMNHLRQFCTTFTQAETREEILTGKPFTEEGFTYFRSSDFKKYLEAQHFRGLADVPLYARLKESGVGHKQYWAGGQNINVWFIKAFDNPSIDIDPRTTAQEGAM